MRMMRHFSPTAAMLCLLGIAATAGVVHAGIVLAGSKEHRSRAFDQIAAHAPVNRFIPLRQVTEATGPIPFDDPTMASSVCRFDLSAGPLRLTIAPFSRGFAAIGFHGQSGAPFYGLTVDADEASAMTVSVMTAAQQSDAASDEEAASPNHDLQIVSPDQQGFVFVKAPLDDTAAQDTLDRIACGSLPPEPAKAAGQD